MKNSTQLYKFASHYLGKGGAIFRHYCGLGYNAPWCNAFVTYVFQKGGDGSLYCNNTKQTYCPNSIKWCYRNLASIPIYLALPCDVIYFDWELNGTPNHIGFVKERGTDQYVYTLEGNTSGGIVDTKTRAVKYVQAVFRPHFEAKYDVKKPLAIDGFFGYNSIACLQKALGIKVDGILGLDTVKALQKKAGVKQDGDWGVKTSKAVQKMTGAEVDGAFGVKSVKALQRWINKQNEKAEKKPADKKPTEKKDPLQKWYDAMKTQYEWSKNQKYHFNSKPTVANSKIEGTCITFPSVSMQRLDLIPKGTYFYYYPKTKKITGTAVDHMKKCGKFTILYPNQTAKALGDKLHKGDVIGFGNPYYHTMVFMGWRDGKPIYNTMGSKKGLKIHYPLYAKRKIQMIVRIKGAIV